MDKDDDFEFGISRGSLNRPWTYLTHGHYSDSKSSFSDEVAEHTKTSPVATQAGPLTVSSQLAGIGT